MQVLRNVSRTSGNPKGKPVILSEVGSNHLGGDKPGWIRDGYAHAYKKYPTIRAMVYFDINTAAITDGPARLAPRDARGRLGAGGIPVGGDEAHLPSRLPVVP